MARGHHSTLLEGVNSVTSLDYARRKYPWATTFVEVLDNDSCVTMFRAMACDSDILTPVITHRWKIIRELVANGTRVLTFWADRRENKLVDNLSKARPGSKELLEAQAQVLERTRAKLDRHKTVTSDNMLHAHPQVFAGLARTKKQALLQAMQPEPQHQSF